MFWDASDFNGDLSAWQVGEVTRMDGSMYTLSPLQDWVLFLGTSFSLLLSVEALILF